MKEKNGETKSSNRAFTLLIILTALLAVEYSGIFEKKEEPVVETEVVYKTVPEDATPLKKESTQEEENYESPVDTPPSKLLDVPYINQLAKYPTGCESISAVMALNYAGYSITPEDFIDNCLPKSPAPYIDNSGRLFGYSPYYSFLGDPYSYDGWGCYYPVIGRCINRLIDGEKHSIMNLHNASLKQLTEYIDNDVPVIIWATQGMKKPKRSQSWTIVDTDKTFTWVSPNHCLLLVGYDDTGYYFNDPLTHKNCRYPADIVEKRYKSMGRQALAIVKAE